MSKSYDNTIALFEGGEKALEQSIMSVVTNSDRPQSADETKGSALYQIIGAFGGDFHQAIAQRFHETDPSARGWGTLKKHAIETINHAIGNYRDEYARLMANPQEVEDQLQKGAQRVRKIAQARIAELRHTVGLRDLRDRRTNSDDAISKTEKPSLQQVIYRDDDKTFAFKIHDAKKNVLATQRGFADPKSAKDAAQSAMEALANA
jgi:tryptophanyl-tRNA synthetase